MSHNPQITDPFIPYSGEDKKVERSILYSHTGGPFIQADIKLIRKGKRKYVVDFSTAEPVVNVLICT